MEYLLLSSPVIVSGLFFICARLAVKRQNKIVQRKVPDIFPQIILRVVAAAVGFGYYFAISYLRNVSFIKPYSGYDLTMGINIFAAIGVVVTMVCYMICLDHLFFPVNADVKMKSVYSFHLGVRVRPVRMTVIVLISSFVVLLGAYKYTYYKADGTFVLHEGMGTSTIRYTQNEIEKVNLNSYEGKGQTFTDLIITFSDHNELSTAADNKGAQLFLSKWNGKVEKTHD